MALDLDRPEIQTMLKAAARKRVVMTPTVAVSEAAEPGDYETHLSKLGFKTSRRKAVKVRLSFPKSISLGGFSP
jgi:hypothetical protein